MMTQNPRNAWFRPVPIMTALASTLAAASAEDSHGWNAFEADFNALGGAAISNKSDKYKAPSEDESGLTASYHELFSDAQLSAALQNPGAESAGLVGFQAEAAAACGSDTLSDEAQKLQNEYALKLSQLTKDIQSALPTVPDAGKTELITSLENELSSRIATTCRDMSLLVSANGNEEVPMPLPFTKGLWEKTSPVVVDLKAGSNTLTFARAVDMRKGIAIKDFTLSRIK